jgi:DNA-binding transcriptional regulator YiaG
MKVGDSVYLVTDQLKTGAGIPAMICGMQDSTVKVAIEEIDGTKVLQVETWDLLPSNLFTRSVLNGVYESYLEIERDHGSILNLKRDAIVRKLVEHSLASQPRGNASISWMKSTGTTPSFHFANGSNASETFTMESLEQTDLVLDELAKFSCLRHDQAFMPQKQPLPVIISLKRWREENGFSQSEAVRVLNETGIAVTLDSLQNWEVGRWSPRANVALALADFLRQNPKVSKKSSRRPRPPAKDK